METLLKILTIHTTPEASQGNSPERPGNAKSRLMRRFERASIRKIQDDWKAFATLCYVVDSITKLPGTFIVFEILFSLVALG